MVCSVVVGGLLGMILVKPMFAWLWRRLLEVWKDGAAGSLDGPDRFSPTRTLALTGKRSQSYGLRLVLVTDENKH